MKSMTFGHGPEGRGWAEGKMVLLGAGEDWQTAAAWFASDGWTVLDVQLPWIALQRQLDQPPENRGQGKTKKMQPGERGDLGAIEDVLQEELGPFTGTTDYPEPEDVSFRWE
jgi:hypothetical protein